MLTDNEIIKALECCGEDGDGCTGCPRLNVEFGATITSCSAGLATNALSIINRQKAEISELQHRNSELEIELKAMRGAANSYKAEVDRLEAENKLFVVYKGQRGLGKVFFFRELEKQIKAEAIKEFAERLAKELSLIKKECRKFLDNGGVFAIEIARKKVDNLVKEMVGDDNENL